MKALVATLIVFAGCLPMPEASDWVDIDQIDGAELSASPTTGPEARDRLRITTFNAELGRDVEAIAEAFETDLDLRATDVLLVQEIESHPGEAGSRASRLASRLQMSYAYAPAREVDGGGTHGLAILSRHALQDVQVMELPRFDFYINSRVRIALAATVAGIRVANVHLDTRLNITERVVQLEPVLITDPAPAAIAGDFNTNPYMWIEGTVPLTNIDAVSDFDQADVLDDYMIANGFDTPTADSGPTQDARVVTLRLDSIYTRDLAVAATGVVGDLGLSDHRPLWVELDYSTSNPTRIKKGLRPEAPQRRSSRRPTRW